MVSVRKYDHSPTPPAPMPTAHTAIVFYGVDGNPDITAVTKHRVVDGSIGLGQVINGDELADTVLQATQLDNVSSTPLIPENILMDTSKYLVWYTKRVKMPIWFRQSRTVKYDVEWTPLLFIAEKQNSKLRILALPNNSRPTLKTKLYNAPLMNIYKNHYLCQGTARLPDKINMESISECIATLTDSVFTHVNNPKTIKSKDEVTTVDHIDFWKNKSLKKERVRASELTYAGRLSDFILNG